MRYILALPAATIVFLAPGLARAEPPRISFTGPTQIDEGQPATIEVTVFDPDPGDTPTWSWDTNNDLRFGELPGAASYTVPAESTDGNGMIRVGVRATDGTETATAYHNIMVANLPPTITSTPPTTAAARREYRYEITAEDPAGANDPIRYTLRLRPPGMEVSGSTLTWTPMPEARGGTFSVVLEADDGDGGTDEQRWEIQVALNTPPTAPTPVSPIERARVPAGMPVTLTVENGSDEDEDPLNYFFQVARLVSFQPPELFGSGEISEGEGGMTSWTTAEPLEPGLWYWRVWVSDGIEQTEPRYGQFVVESAMPDAGPSLNADAGTIPAPDGGLPPPSSGGCGCSVGARGPAALPLALGLGLFAWVARRRRRR